jgi:hypothetical protein
LTTADIVSLLKDGGSVGIAALFIYLYMQERKENRTLQADRLTDLKVSMDSLHKSIGTLDKVLVNGRDQ